MRVLQIVEGTSVDGPGLRTSIYFAGCSHHCDGCHNPQSWNPASGTEMSLDEIMEVIAYNEAPVTMSGGDPLLQAEQLSKLVSRIKKELGYNVWCYTGYRWEEIEKSPILLKAVQDVDVLVDGRFEKANRNTSLLFRGSPNQRLIDVAKTLETNSIVVKDMYKQDLSVGL